MIKKISTRLGIKLFLFLTIIIILAVAPLSYIALNSLTRYGMEASLSNERQIRTLAVSYLKNVAKERAQRYQEFFNRIEIAAAMLGKQASIIYSDLFYYAESPIYTPRFTLTPSNNIWISDINDPVTSLYWGDRQINLDATVEIMAMTHMKPLLMQVLEDNPEAVASHVIGVSGAGQYSSKKKQNKESLLKLPPVTVFDLRDGEPVTMFANDNKPQTNVRWTDIYKDDIIDGFMLTASSPMYDLNGTFRGISGIDVPLQTLIEETLNYNSKRENSTVLFSFLLDENEKIIALPEQYYELMGLSIDYSKYTYSSHKPEHSLFASTKENVVELAQQFRLSQERVHELTLDEQNYYVVTSRLAKQNWMFGLVVKQSDMLLSVEGSRKALDDTVKKLVEKGVILSLAAILIALAIIYFLIKYLITPLRHLADATQRVASGDLTVRSPVTTTDETGVLSESFNSMVERLQVIQDEQERYAESLRLEVIQQNLELVSQKKELESNIDFLNSEVERRQIIAEALRTSQEQYYGTFETSASGVYIIEDGAFTYVNNSFATTIFRSSKEELVGTSPLELVSEEDRQLVAMNMQRRLTGVEIPPYTVKCIRKDGTTFYGEIWSKVSTWQNKQVMVGTIADVSSLRRKEEILLVQDRQLQQSLDEKEILLKEIYHRTKNNMLVIISMLDLQAQDIDDSRLKFIFKETENRIRTMALVHEKLYESQNLTEIDMGNYLAEVANSLLTTMILDDRITLESDIEPIAIDIDYAVPLGLIINEIVTNSIVHAFPRKRSGIISLRITRVEEDKIMLTISDNGIGLPEHIDIESSSSFGLGIIITSLVKLQLKGEIEVDCAQGTHYRIIFPEPKRAKRI